MANKVVKNFTQNSSWNCPAGVTQVTVRTLKNPNSFFPTFNNSSYFIDSFGNIRSFGANQNGQLGIGNVTAQSSPVLVLGGLTFQSVIAGGNNEAYALSSNGSIYAWGANAAGELGVGDTTPRSSPVLVLGGLTFQAVIAGTSVPASTFGITTGGALYAWGYNGNGQLGIGSATNQSSPSLVGSLIFQSVVAGSVGQTYGLTTSGVLYAWGKNQFGELGVGDTTPRSSPVLVLGGLTFQSIIYTNPESVYGLTAAGVLYAWGRNQNGCLGNGNITNQSSPVLVLGGLTFQSIIPGLSGSTYGLTSAGVLYAWGNNSLGQLGTGDVIPRSSPVLVLGGLTFQSVSVGNVDEVYGITTSGVLYAWGGNTTGELGTGDVIPRSSPVLVLGGLTFQSVIAGYDQQVYAITTSGSLYSWGFNPDGELGIGNVTPQSSPILVLGGAACNIQKISNQQTIAVVPGSTYAITIQQFIATFGLNAIGSGPVSSLSLEYFQ